MSQANRAPMQMIILKENTKSSPQQFDLFADKSRWPKKPYCTDDLETGIRPRSLVSAIQKKYIQANPPHLRVWTIFDVDYPGAAVAWEDANLPPPSWSTIQDPCGFCLRNPQA